MKAAIPVFVLGGLGLLLALPARSQHGGGGRSFGGFSGHVGGVVGSGGRGFHGGRSSGPAPKGFTGRGFAGVPTRPAPMPARGNALARGFSGRPIRPSVVFVPQTSPPAPMSHVRARGFASEIRDFRPVHPRFFRFHHGFGFPFCSPVFGVSFTTRHFRFFEHQVVCFPSTFVSPFFFPFFPVVGSSLVAPPVQVFSQGPLGTSQAGGEASAEEPASDFGAPSTRFVPPSEPARPSEQEAAQPLTLLQLKDGSMYGLADYWVEHGRLHYITSYGGENSVPFDWIDFDKTVQLNAENGVEFVLRPKPSNR